MILNLIKTPIFCELCNDVIGTVETHRDTPLHQVAEICNIIKNAHYERNHQEGNQND